jgi:hypothetical protein
MQTTNHLFMVRPAHFAFNEQTAESNAFQQRADTLKPAEISAKAVAEFDAMVALLRSQGVTVTVGQDSNKPAKPDAVFPNNWFSTHDDGQLIFYPMFAPIRRLERDEMLIGQIEKIFDAQQVLHLETYEEKDMYLEGTGSLVLDRVHRLAYACLSPRTDEALLDVFCRITGYQKVVFDATDAAGQAIYHTNVLMAMGDAFVVICLDSVRDAAERAMLLAHFERTKKTVIAISLAQMNQFAGNMLQVRNGRGKTFLVMSNTAFQSLTAAQKTQIEQFSTIIAPDIATIETYGGGSARCMIAEIF